LIARIWPLGIQKSDQSETVLHRLIRSSGVSGLSAIHPIRNDLEIPIIRPLLALSRDDILQYVRIQNLEYRTDSMNNDLRFTRTKIRHQLLPLLKRDFNQNVEEALSHLAQLAYEDELYWTQHIEKLLNEIGEASADNTASIQFFLQLSKPEQTRLLRLYGMNYDVDLSMIQIRDIVRLLERSEPQGELHLSKSICFYRRYDSFYFAPPVFEEKFNQITNIEVPSIQSIPELNIQIETHILDRNILQIDKNNVWSADFDSKKIIDPVTIRTRYNGDVIQPLGMKGKKKVKKIFQENKISLEQRESYPILCFGNDIAWIPGICVSEQFKVNSQTTSILRIVISELR
jgi:tRNA(Ile)-lysidine synthase